MYMTITTDHPSRLMHWNTLSSAQKMLSKLVTSQFGFRVFLPQQQPSGQGAAPQIASSPSSSIRTYPVSMFTQRYLSMPMNKLSPPIAKIRKKKNRTIMVSERRGMASMTDDTMTLRPSMLLTKRSGRRTRNARKPEAEPPPAPTISNNAVVTQMKSSQHQQLLKYDPLFQMKPSENMRRTISIVQIMLNVRSIFFSVGVSSLVESLPARVMQFKRITRIMKPSKYR